MPNRIRANQQLERPDQKGEIAMIEQIRRAYSPEFWVEAIGEMAKELKDGRQVKRVVDDLEVYRLTVWACEF